MSRGGGGGGEGTGRGWWGGGGSSEGESNLTAPVQAKDDLGSALGKKGLGCQVGQWWIFFSPQIKAVHLLFYGHQVSLSGTDRLHRRGSIKIKT